MATASPTGIVYVALLRGESILLQLRQNTGFMDGHWSCSAAGHLEPGEPPLAAALREAAEELGVQIHANDLERLTVQERGHDGASGAPSHRDHFYLCRKWSGQPAVREPDKCAALSWFALTDLPSPLVPQEAPIIARLAEPTRLPG